MDEIRPFHFHASDEALADLKKRVTSTKWPDKEQVAGHDAGRAARDDAERRAALGDATTGARCEARLNAVPNFITEIDGLDIHFIHVRSKHENALPMIVTHGWPGSIIEQMKIIGPLTDPTAHGGDRGGRLPSRDPVAAGLRLLRQADAKPAGTRRASPRPGRC